MYKKEKQKTKNIKQKNKKTKAVSNESCLPPLKLDSKFGPYSKYILRIYTYQQGCNCENSLSV